LMLANGESEIKIERKTPIYKEFKNALNDLCIELAQMIVRDGEGATKFVTVIVKEARTSQEAKKVAKAVANSLLVKTALYG
ncbi:MAG: bifunctional ornithine acetyltransferase/N-acetylglutamate synthase, partial [Thermodesulfovibrio sp.]|nr:bifunctional ornithine acetyltransferase/N-acetylglutamate synthase [Thermodesulfovibrio sp.]